MSTKIATFDRVKAAIIALRQANERVTADRIIQHLGGGSKPTVLKHMKTLRNEDVPEDPVPAAVFDLARAALADVYAAGAKAEEDRNRGQMERMAGIMDELDAQIEELAGDNARLTSEIGKLLSERDEAIKANRSLDQALQATRTDLAAVQNELAAERATAAVKLTEVMERFEASLSAMAAKNESSRTK